MINGGDLSLLRQDARQAAAAAADAEERKKSFEAVRRGNEEMYHYPTPPQTLCLTKILRRLLTFTAGQFLGGR